MIVLVQESKVAWRLVMASMKDVAAKAGVGMGTVSRVLNNSGPVKPETREKILKIIQELDYTPNEMARSFKKQETKLIGFMVPMINHPFFSELAYYIEDELYKSGYKLMLCSSSTNREKEVEYLQMLNKNQVDGIITISYHDIYQSEPIDMPLVTIDRYISDSVPHVTSNNYEGGRIAASKLLEAGCKKIAYVGGEPRFRSTVTDRKRALVEVARVNKVPYIVYEASDLVRDTGKSEQAYIEQVVKEFVDLYPDVDGVMTSADQYAYALINELESRGKSVPEDIKVIGYDGVPSMLRFSKVLSTVKQPIEQIGRQSAKILVDFIQNKEVPMESMFEVEYIDGETCK